MRLIACIQKAAAAISAAKSYIALEPLNGYSADGTVLRTWKANLSEQRCLAALEPAVFQRSQPRAHSETAAA